MREDKDKVVENYDSDDFQAGEHALCSQVMDDLFGEVPQPARAAPPPPRPLTASDVRDQMVALIEALRGSETMPFGPAELTKHVAMIPIMAQWLTPAEGEQLVLEFEAEVERLRKAA